MSVSVADLLRLHDEGNTFRAISRLTGIHHRTVSHKLKSVGVFSTRGPKRLNVADGGAVCSKCDQLKALDQFHMQRCGSKHPYRLSYCNTCRTEQTFQATRRAPSSFLRERFRRLAARCVKSNITVDIDAEYLIARYNAQSGNCFYTDETLSIWARGKPTRQSLSIDRVVPEVGYCRGNVVLCTNLVNTVKHNLALTDIRAWMPEWGRRIDKHIGGPLFGATFRNDNASTEQAA